MDGTLPFTLNHAAMKIACSSASFAGSLAAGTLTQLEWLDVCANELEVDGVVFEALHFPREDTEYLAQCKKLAADLGLTIAAVAADGVLGAHCERYLTLARELGAPLAIARAPAAREDARAWGEFTGSVKVAARAAKSANVTLAVRAAAGTLCAASSDLKRLAKDVDSAWLRFVCDGATAQGAHAALLESAVIARYDILDLERFGEPRDGEAARVNAALARFRGFIVLECADTQRRSAYHEAIARFADFRARSLSDVAAI